MSTSIELNTDQREVAVPADLAGVLAKDEKAGGAFERLSYTHRKEWVRWIEEAKKAKTRVRRVEKIVESLRAGQR
jgi:uncharacterized protein YdeI (YjbR/CyaY-like superfamily)